MKKVIIDTNALLRFLLDDIPSQKKATEQILIQARQKEITLHVAQAIIFEIDFILRKYYHFEKVVVIEHLKSLIATNYINIESQNVFNKALYTYAKNNISFVDSFLLAKAYLENAELFTFDQHIQKLQANYK